MTARKELSSWEKINDNIMEEFKFQSVNKLIEQSFRENWDRLALSNYQGVSLCYRDVARRIEKLHIAFEQCFLHKGDKVAPRVQAR